MPRLVLVLVLVLGAGGCRQDMHDQAKLEPLEASTFFADGRGSRPLVAGTVPRGAREVVAPAPPAGPVTRPMLERGRERYDIYCAPCHSRDGEGDGMIVRRGYRKPPSFHVQRLRDAPALHYYDVMTNGFGAMPDYAAQVPVADRWAIIAYIRALQLSQGAKLADVPQDERAKLEGLPR